MKNTPWFIYGGDNGSRVGISDLNGSVATDLPMKQAEAIVLAHNESVTALMNDTLHAFKTGQEFEKDKKNYNTR